MRPETTRMFENPVLERFSRIHPATPFVAWLPVIAYCTWTSARAAAIGPARTAALMAAGVLVWTLSEYVLHRFVFHYEHPSAFGRRAHFVLHGVHHDYPRDGDRLVMPLGASIPIGALFFLAFRALVGAQAVGVFAGFAIGYLAYDGLHYAIHHFKWKGGAFGWLRMHHLRHHHADAHGGYGVSSPLWDIVFRSMPRNAAELRAAPALDH